MDVSRKMSRVSSMGRPSLAVVKRVSSEGWCLMAGRCGSDVVPRCAARKEMKTGFGSNGSATANYGSAAARLYLPRQIY